MLKTVLSAPRPIHLYKIYRGWTYTVGHEFPKVDDILVVGEDLRSLLTGFDDVAISEVPG